MSPRHISVEQARKRLADAKVQLHEAIEKRMMHKEDQEYLQWVLDRGEQSCKKAEKEFSAKRVN